MAGGWLRQRAPPATCLSGCVRRITPIVRPRTAGDKLQCACETEKQAVCSSSGAGESTATTTCVRLRTMHARAVLCILLCAVPLTAAQAHKEDHKDWRLTCGEGGEKDPKKPNWTPPTWVYLNCGQFNIGEVVFASWGTPEGSCTGAVGTSDSFHKGSCDAKTSVAKVAARCVGKPKCKIPAGPAGASDGSGGNDFFGASVADMY